MLTFEPKEKVIKKSFIIFFVDEHPRACLLQLQDLHPDLGLLKADLQRVLQHGEAPGEPH